MRRDEHGSASVRQTARQRCPEIPSRPPPACLLSSSPRCPIILSRTAIALLANACELQELRLELLATRTSTSTPNSFYTVDDPCRRYGVAALYRSEFAGASIGRAR